MKTFWSSLFTGVISGAATGVGSYLTNSGGHINGTAIGVSAGIGALVGIINHFRTPPGTTSIPNS